MHLVDVINFSGDMQFAENECHMEGKLQQILKHSSWQSSVRCYREGRRIPQASNFVKLWVKTIKYVYSVPNVLSS